MKTIILVLVILSFMFIGLWIFGEEYQKDKIIGFFNSYSNERTCMEYYREDFKDPNTIYFSKSYLAENNTRDDYDSMLKVEIMAKNSYGAYGKEIVECPIIKGEIPSPSVGDFEVPTDRFAQYYIISEGGTASIPRITTKRVGSNNINFSYMKFNCAKKTGKYLGIGSTLEELKTSKLVLTMAAISQNSISDSIMKQACK